MDRDGSEWYMDGGEATKLLDLDLGGTGQGWRWHVHLETWMDLRWCLYGSEMQLWGAWMEVRSQLDGGDMQFWGPGLGWDSIWMEVSRESKGLNGVEIGHGWKWDTNTSIPGWGYDWTLVKPRCICRDFDWGATGQGCKWNMTLVEMRCQSMDFDGSESAHKWQWEVHLVSQA